MDKPVISYHVLRNDAFVKQNSYYAGTYTGDNTISVIFRIWNNYRGTTAVEDLSDFNLVLHFLTEEDNKLLQYITVSVPESQVLNLIPETNALVCSFIEPVTLSGKANTGSGENTGNYVNINVEFKPTDGACLKDHDLKSLVVEIVEM